MSTTVLQYLQTVPINPTTTMSCQVTVSPTCIKEGTAGDGTTGTYFLFYSEQDYIVSGRELLEGEGTGRETLCDRGTISKGKSIEC